MNQKLSFEQAMTAALEKCLVRRASWGDHISGIISVPEGAMDIPVNGKSRRFAVPEYKAILQKQGDGAYTATAYNPSQAEIDATDWGVVAE